MRGAPGVVASLTALAALLVAGCGSRASGASDGAEEGGRSPTGGLEVALSTDRSVYAPGEAIRMTLSLANGGVEVVELSFSSAQRFDFVVRPAGRGADGPPVWRWSEGRAFAQVLGEERLAPGDTLRYRVSLEGGLAAGDYLLEGTVTASGAAPRGRLPVRVGQRPSSASTTSST